MFCLIVVYSCSNADCISSCKQWTNASQLHYGLGVLSLCSRTKLHLCLHGLVYHSPLPLFIILILSHDRQTGPWLWGFFPHSQEVTTSFDSPLVVWACLSHYDRNISVSVKVSAGVMNSSHKPLILTEMFVKEALFPQTPILHSITDIIALYEMITSVKSSTLMDFPTTGTLFIFTTSEQWS